MEGLLYKNAYYNVSIVLFAISSRASLSNWIGNGVQIGFHENQKTQRREVGVKSVEHSKEQYRTVAKLHMDN